MKQLIIGVAYGFTGKVPKELDDAILSIENLSTIKIDKKIDYDKIKNESLEVARALHLKVQ